MMSAAVHQEFKSCELRKATFPWCQNSKAVSPFALLTLTVGLI